MRKNISILFIAMLLFQTVISSIVLPAQIFAEGTQESENSIIDNASVTDEDDSILDLETGEASGEKTDDEAEVREEKKDLEDGDEVEVDSEEEEIIETDEDRAVAASTGAEAEVKSADVFAVIEENLFSSFEFVINPGPNEIIIENGEVLEVNPDNMNTVSLVYGITKPDEVDIAAGDIYTIDLPSFFQQSIENQPIIVDGTEVATYSIVEGQVIITFNESVNEFDNVEMDVNLTGSFNTEVFEVEQEVNVDVPFRDGTSYTATIRAEQRDYEGEDKKEAGSPYILNENGDKQEVDRNPEFIDWTIRVNDSMEDFENATVIDDLGDYLAIEEGSFVIERIIRNYNNEEIGRELVDETPEITGSGFVLNLGGIEDAYDITYTTSVTRPDGGGTHSINNDARINLDGDVTNVSDEFEGTWSGDLPAITKEGALTEDPHVIDWVVEYNYGQEALGTVTLTDELSHGEVLLGTIEVFEVDTDTDGNIIGEPVLIEVTPVMDDNGNITIPGLNADEQAYYITFSSSVPLGLDTTIVNTVSDNLAPQNKDEARVSVNTIPDGDKAGRQLVDDDGRPYIDWTITMNSEQLNIGSIEVIDIFDPVYLEIETDDPSLYELRRDGEVAENFSVNPYTHDDGREGFELEITDAGPHTYEFVYRTYYTDAGMQESEVANQAELIFKDGEGEGIGEPLNVDFSQEGPKVGISKTGEYEINPSYVLGENEHAQVINWVIEFNETNIQLNNPTLTDNFTSGNYEYIEDSFKVFADGEAFNNYTFTENIDETGFEIQINEETNAEFRVEFQTTVDNENNLLHRNEAAITWQNGADSDDAEVAKRDAGIEKNAEVVINEDGSKSINWTIAFNTQWNVINDFVLTDNYSPEDVEISNFRIFRDNEDEDPVNLVQGEDYNLTLEQGSGEFVVTMDQLSPMPHYLEYTTTLSPEQEINNVENHVDIDYTGGDGSAEETVNPPTIGVEKSATNLDKETEHPVISWEIIANTDPERENHFVNLVDPVLTDEIPRDQRLLGETIEVTRADGTEMNEDDVHIDYDDHSFEIHLPDGPYQYMVTFDTEILEFPSVNEQIDRYTNSTTLSNANHADVSDDAYQDYFGDGDSSLLGKSGEQNSDTENIDWTIGLNSEGFTIHNFKVEDQLSENQSYLTDSVVINDAYGEELTEDEYNIDFGEDNRSFTLTIGNGTINEAYELSYSTRLDPDLIGNIDVSNAVEIHGGTEQREMYSESIERTAQQWFYGGGGSGQTVQFQLNKESPIATPLEGVEFSLQREDFNGNIVDVNADIITNEEGVFISSGNLRAGRYILTENEESTPEGYQALEHPIYFEIVYAKPEEEGEYTATITDSDWNLLTDSNASALGNVITVVNDYAAVSVPFQASKTLHGKDNLEAGQFNFELVDADDEVITTATNDEHGTIIFDDQLFDTIGTYNYNIREVEGTLVGVSYDDSVYEVEVNVSEGENGLETVVTYLDGDAEFVNTYEAAPVDVEFEAQKVLQGPQELSEEQFAFNLLDSNDEILQTKENDADGQVTFDEITFDEAGEYTYTIVEVEGSQGGIEYDDSVFEVTVFVTDDGQGQLHATVNYPNNTIPAFVNNYSTESTSVILEAQKVLDGRDLAAGEFEFHLIGQNDNVDETVTNDAEGSIVFSEISYDTAGEYNYTIQEIAGELGGIVYDATVQNVTVTVTDNGEGQLVAEAEYENEEAVFRNLYSTTQAEANIVGEKVLEGQLLEDEQFSFELLNEEGQIIQTVENDAEGNIVFETISYDQPGEYNYTVHEVEGSQGGVTYDESSFSVTVAVTDNGEGQLEATVNYIDGPAVFTNAYEAAPSAVVFEAQKNLEGQQLSTDQFAFQLVNDTDEVVQTARNNQNGQVIFEEVTFDTAGTYHYTIREVDEGLGGINYDPAVYDITVEVTDNGNGQLFAAESYNDGPAVFTNTYTTDPDSIVLEAQKILEGQGLVNGQFIFELTDEAGEVIQTVSNNAEGQVIFEEIGYDTVGTYTYTISEVEGVQGGMTYDDTRYTVVVSVEDDGEGNLVAEAHYIDGSAVFTNHYETTPDSVVIEASKVLEGQELRTGQFTFELVDEDGNVLQVKENNAEGQIIFDEISYSTAGDYNYTIREVEGTQGGITYDDTVYNVIVSVTDDREGTVTAEVQYADGPAVFTNTYTPAPDSVVLEASKVLEGQDLRTNRFDFELVDGANNVIQTVSNNANGQVIFDEMSFETVGIYEYTIRETAGDDVNINYDESVFSVIVEITDDEEGQLHASVNYVDGTPVFENTFKKVSVGDYVWFDENNDGLQDESDVPIEGVVLTIEDEEGNPVTDVYGNPVGPAITDENGYYIFENLRIDHTYTVRIDQDASADVLITYLPTLHEQGDDREVDSSTWFAVSRHLTVDGEHDPSLDFGFVRKTVEIPVTKIWEDNDNAADTRPDFITVNVLANGEIVHTVDITEENNWEFTFHNLPKYLAGEEVEYTITEEAVEGYESAIDGFEITNTLIENNPNPVVPEGESDGETPIVGSSSDESEGSKLPQTATNMYNMLAIGFALLILGTALILYHRRREA